MSARQGYVPQEMDGLHRPSGGQIKQIMKYGDNAISSMLEKNKKGMITLVAVAAGLALLAFLTRKITVLALILCGGVVGCCIAIALLVSEQQKYAEEMQALVDGAYWTLEGYADEVDDEGGVQGRRDTVGVRFRSDVADELLTGEYAVKRKGVAAGAELLLVFIEHGRLPKGKKDKAFILTDLMLESTNSSNPLYAPQVVRHSAHR